MEVEDLGHRIEALAQQAVALVNADQNVQALDTFHQALDLLETVPSRSARKQVEGALRWRLASALLPLGRDDEAESELRRALDVLSHVWDADHERIRVLIALAGLLTQQTRLDEAEEVLRECHETILVPEDDILYMTHLDGIALWLNATGRHAEAVTFLRRTTAHYRRIEGAEMDLCFALEVLALAESAIGDIDDAVSHAREAVQVRERAGHSSSSVSSARANLANVLMAAGRMQESGEEVEKAEALQADIPEQGTDRARLLLVRSNGEVMAGHFVQALHSIEAALEAARGAIRREPMLEAQCLIGLGSGRLVQDDPQGAVAAFTEAKNIYMNFNAPSTGAVVCLTGMAKARAMAGLFPLAMAALDEARGLMDPDARRRERVSVDSTQAQILLTWALDVGDREQTASLCRLALAVAVPAIIRADEQRFQFESEGERSAWIGDLERGALIDTAFRAAREIGDAAVISDLIATLRTVGTLDPAAVGAEGGGADGDAGRASEALSMIVRTSAIGVPDTGGVVRNPEETGTRGPEEAGTREPEETETRDPGLTAAPMLGSQSATGTVGVPRRPGPRLVLPFRRVGLDGYRESSGYRATARVMYR